MPKSDDTWSSISRCWPVTQTTVRRPAPSGLRPGRASALRSSSLMTGASLIASGRVPRIQRTFMALDVRAVRSMYAGRRGLAPQERKRQPAGDLSDLIDQDTPLPEDAHRVNHSAQGRGEDEPREVIEKIGRGYGPTDHHHATSHHQRRD